MLKAYANPKMLRWGRETAGYSVDDVVRKINRKTVTAETVQKWESGDSLMSYAQFKKLARLYRRPTALFYAPKPRWSEKTDADFRGLPKGQKIPPSVRFAIREAVVRQLDLKELHNGRTPSLKQLGKIRPNPNLSIANAQKIAQDFRAMLGVLLPEQKKWRSASGALRQWRTAVENLGVWVFKKPFDEKDGGSDFDGFYLPDSKFPIIYLNSRRTPERQIFTLFHELGHCLLRQGGVCFRHKLVPELQGENRKIEEFCNVFASEFLVPDADLNLTRMLTENEMQECANAYRVSREVILRKCKDKKLIGEDKSAAIAKRWERARLASGVRHHASKESQLGAKYIRLVFLQCRDQQFYEYQLSDYLGVKVHSLPRLESALYKA